MTVLIDEDKLTSSLQQRQLTITSCLPSFILSKIDIHPIHRYLLLSHHLFYQDRYHQIHHYLLIVLSKSIFITQ
ncbi:hypothetical protein C2G38_2117585 [Gigaspora rosea]|uniref:Uncharacterized protein n=1 Tax=Gigaspora rosea TaxID=44941 RepID=A0A397UAM4_9GLOM|nr:hypothetical protein C2G38_2117585 [Gigaspora rosea]